MKQPSLHLNNSGVYEVRWREEGCSKRKSLRTQDETIAQREFAAFLLRVQPRPIYKVAEAWELRQRDCLDQVAAPQRIRDCWKQLLPYFGAMSIEQITGEDIAQYQAQRMAKGRAASTVRRELVELQATLHHMVTIKKLTREQLPVIKLPAESEARPHFLTETQFRRVFEHAASKRRQPDEFTRLELFLCIGVHTGQRKRAIERLEWDQVDFELDVIHFAKQGERVTKKRKASIPMRAELREMLAAEKAAASSCYVLRHSGSIRSSFESLMAELSLDHVTPHVLRHSFISQLLMKNVSAYTVGRIVAVSVKRIEKTYGHLSDDFIRAALAR